MEKGMMFSWDEMPHWLRTIAVVQLNNLPRGENIRILEGDNPEALKLEHVMCMSCESRFIGGDLLDGDDKFVGCPTCGSHDIEIPDSAWEPPSPRDPRTRINRGQVDQVKDIYLRDEDGNPLEDDDDKSQAYVHVTEARGEECITMTFSPKEIDELEEACQASRPSRPMRGGRKNARNLKRREPARAKRQSR